MTHGKIPEWYNECAESEEASYQGSENSKITNRTIEKILKKHKVKTVLDLTCGTGSQVFYLLERGYHVIGSDISPGMLKIAQTKAKKAGIKIKFLHGDMRDQLVGQFDAVITIFNAIGHLTKADFKKTIQNVSRNLNDGGIYIFDIINLNYVLDKDNIIKLSYECMKTIKNKQVRELQHSIIGKDGILTSHTTSYEQEKSKKLTVSNTSITLQLYTAKELRKLLSKNGFQVLEQVGIDGSKFSDKKTERIVTIAKVK